MSYIKSRLKPHIIELRRPQKIPTTLIGDEYSTDLEEIEDIPLFIQGLEYQYLLNPNYSKENREKMANSLLIAVQKGLYGQLPRVSGTKKVKHYRGNDQYDTFEVPKVDPSARPRLNLIISTLDF